MEAPVLRRLPRWEDRLAAHIETRRTTPFAWGDNDCFTFAMDAVAAITGVALYPPTWTDALSAMREIEKHGSYADMISSVLGIASQNWKAARRGDVVMAEQDGRTVSMLCVGSVLCGPGVDRMEFKPLPDARLVWRVG